MSEAVKQNLLAAFRYLLKPLVRLALKNDLSFEGFSKALKEAYVDVATVQVRVSGDVPTNERISLMTSIPTSEVQQILQSMEGAEFALAAQQERPLPNLLTAWHTNPLYAGPYGVCRDLKFPAGEVEEFAALAAETCPGIPPEAALAELMRTGCVVSVGSNYYRAVKRSYVPDALSATSILLFAQVVHNFCETAEMNLRARGSNSGAVMQRIIFTRFGITKDELVEFDEYIRLRGQSFADEVDNWLSQRDVSRSDGLHINTGVGFYHYIVNEDDESALSKQVIN